MPHFTIDGKEYEYEGSPRLLEFAQKVGVEIPFFCYHPAMSTPTNCRMCLCEVGFPVKDRATGEPVLDENGQPAVNWGRKPATACNQGISPGMIVKTQFSSPAVKEMQEGVLEYMLSNHPLDCPICDQAGECPLQIWTYKYGAEGSRFEVAKSHRPKRIELGPHVVLDGERCINCTRCTRFTEEISGSHQLTIIGRGEKNHPSTAPGETFNDPYSMNTIDLCPVGALTSKEFRFSARVWEMSHSEGVCTGCAKGCSVDVWVRDNKVMRLTPKENLKVNQYWMCDEGRLNIAKYNENRVSGVKKLGDVPVEFEEGVAHAATILKKGMENPGRLLVLGSAHASMESNFALKVLFTSLEKNKIHYVPFVKKGWGDDFLRKDDRTVNQAGVQQLGFNSTSIADIRRDILSGDVKTLVVLEDDGVLGALGKDLERVKVVSLSKNYFRGHEFVDCILPAASSIESICTFINADGVPQVSRMAKEIKQMTPQMWMGLSKSRLDKAAVAVDKWRDDKNIFDVLPSWSLIAKMSSQLGKQMKFVEHKDVFQKLKNEVVTLNNVKISYKIPKQAFKSTQFDFAIN